MKIVFPFTLLELQKLIEPNEHKKSRNSQYDTLVALDKI